MIADYVNDQIDVVGRAFLGLSVACARCHDHKFDPISTEDYYALAGIFFSTRLVPGPVPGNTPLVRVPLLSPDELAEGPGAGRRGQAAAGGAGAAAPRCGRPRVSSPIFVTLIADKTARYLVAACEYRQGRPESDRQTAEAIATPARARPEVAGRVGRLSRPGRGAAVDRTPSDASRRGGRDARRPTAREGRGRAASGPRRAGRTKGEESRAFARRKRPWRARA